MKYIFTKTIHLIMLLITVSTVSYIFMCLSPIDPVRAYVGDDMLRLSAEQKEQIERKWGLTDKPLVRYGKWLKNILRGELGQSLIYNKPVKDVIFEKFFLSLGLMICAWCFSGLLGFGLGILAGSRSGSFVDRTIRWFAYTIASCPTFWLGMLMMMCFSLWLKITPICCASPMGVNPQEVSWGEWLHHLLLPALTLSMVGVTNVLLHTRQKLKDVLKSDFALLARAQGASLEGIIWHHGLRNTSLPAIHVHFASFSELFGGAILAEYVFAYPGLGQALVQAGLRSDVPLMLGIVLFSALFVFMGNTAADLISRIVDPRIRFGGEA